MAELLPLSIATFASALNPLDRCFILAISTKPHQDVGHHVLELQRFASLKRLLVSLTGERRLQLTARSREQRVIKVEVARQSARPHPDLFT